MAQLEALIFDVDGTLADTEDFHRQAFNLAFADAGLDWSWDQSLYKSLLAVTGGSGVVRQAMTSGKRAICAGPGNPPVVVDATADLDHAARNIIAGASFDNNIVCVDEKEVIAVESIVDDLEHDVELQQAAEALSGDGTIDLTSIEALADSAPVRKLLNMVLLLAIKDHASDVHFEPFEDEFRIRIKADGVLFEMVPPPRHLAFAITTRIKVMANLDIAERRLPQDGRIKATVGGVQHEFTSMEGVVEDVTEIILNLKRLLVKVEGEPRARRRPHPPGR